MKYQMTLEDHARLWWRAKGIVYVGEIPQDAYERWVEYAFSNMRGRSNG